MGDMADDIIAQIDMLDFLDIDEDAYLPQPITCKYCKTRDLHWEETKDGWRLFNTVGEIHLCLTEHSSAIDDFRDFIVPQWKGE